MHTARRQRRGGRRILDRQLGAPPQHIAEVVTTVAARAVQGDDERGRKLRRQRAYDLEHRVQAARRPCKNHDGELRRLIAPKRTVHLHPTVRHHVGIVPTMSAT